jgi:beta-N-acetylhexosaminidase
MVGLPELQEPDHPLVEEVLGLGVSGIFINHDNVDDEEQLRELVAGIRARAPRPLLVPTDEESGRVSNTREIVGAGPSPRRLAAQRTPSEVRAFAGEIGAALHDLGIDMDLAPSLDLDDGPSDAIIGDRSFSGEADVATTYGMAFTRGLADAGVVPTVKHFPGQGRSQTDTHAETDLLDVTLRELKRTDLVPFQAAIDQGAPVVMLNHLTYTALDRDLPASMSPKAYALLREMGFEGVAITDSIGMQAVHSRWDFPDAAVRAIAAGADAVLATDGRQAVRMRDALVAAVRDGELDEERLDEAAARTTALAGGDPVETACLRVETPVLRPDPLTGPPTAHPTPRPTD